MTFDSHWHLHQSGVTIYCQSEAKAKANDNRLPRPIHAEASDNRSSRPSSAKASDNRLSRPSDAKASDNRLSPCYVPMLIQMLVRRQIWISNAVHQYEYLLLHQLGVTIHCHWPLHQLGVTIDCLLDVRPMSIDCHAQFMQRPMTIVCHAQLKRRPVTTDCLLVASRCLSKC